MTNCNLLTDYLDNKLGPRRIAEFEQHLESCGRCRTAVDLDAQLDEIVQDAWQTVFAPDHLHRSIASLGVNETRDDKQSNRLADNEKPLSPLRWIAVAATIAAICAAGIMLTNASKNDVSIRNSNPPNKLDQKPDAELRAEQASTTPRVILANREGVNDVILAMQPQSNHQFTIIKAYPVFKSSKSNLKIQGIENDQIN